MNKMKSILLTIFILTTFCRFSFGQKSTNVIFPPPVLGMDAPEYTSACELPNHVKELVYTRFIYSGVEEYWSLHSPDKKCKNLKIELKTPDSVNFTGEQQKLFNAVHGDYMNNYLVIDAIGTFENGNASGYGHLGSNNAEFIVRHFVNIQIVNRTK